MAEVFNILKIVGIIILSIIFSLIVEDTNLYMLEGEIYWTKYISFDSMFFNYMFLDICIIPTASIILMLIGHWLCLLVKNNKYYIALPLTVFCVRLIRIVFFLFVDKSKTEITIFKEVDYGVLWYCCATISSILIMFCYITVINKMIKDIKEKNT